MYYFIKCTNSPRPPYPVAKSKKPVKTNKNINTPIHIAGTRVVTRTIFTSTKLTLSNTLLRTNVIDNVFYANHSYFANIFIYIKCSSLHGKLILVKVFRLTWICDSRHSQIDNCFFCAIVAWHGHANISAGKETSV